MPQGNGRGNPGLIRGIIVLVLVIIGLFMFFRWNYQVNQENAQNTSGAVVRITTEESV